jgi:hypothetical protein
MLGAWVRRPLISILYHPIIYVRGFAATQGEIEETVSDPYMGFNIGSTKARSCLDR